MLSLKVNDLIYTNFKDISISFDMDNLCGAFSIVSSVDRYNLFPIKLNDFIQLYADDVLVLSAFVDELAVDYSYDSHDIRVGGRSIIADIVDSCVVNGGSENLDASVFNKDNSVSTKHRIEYSGATSLEKIARKLLDNNNMSETQVINKAGTIKDFTAGDIVSPEIGVTVFEFLETLARKRQVLLNSDEYGNLVLSRGSGDSSDVVVPLTNDVVNLENNNILSGSLSLTNYDRFNTYIANSSLNPINFTGKVSVKTSVSQGAYSSDEEVRETRLLQLNMEESSNTETCKDRAEWENNIRKARSVVYSAVVQGHSYNGTPFKINTLAKVKDDFCNQLDETMLIKAVDFNYSTDNGSTTTLTCVPKNSFLIDLSEPEVATESKTDAKKASKKSKLNLQKFYNKAVEGL